jgi:hypothetical protein
LCFFFSCYPKAQIKERRKLKNVRFKTWSVHILPPISAQRQNHSEEIVEGHSNKKARRSTDSSASKTSAGIDTKLYDSIGKVHG